jgi:molybdopterin-guanine dinucleotide biosynthesis protein A
MGTAKAALEWHGSTLLRRVVGLLARSVDGPVVVVRAPGQSLPPLPDPVEVVEDRVEGRGPLQGLATGLAALDGRVDTAFVAATDLPFLHPAFVRRLVSALDRVDVALPVVQGVRQPLAAAYRTGLAGSAHDLLAQGRDRPAHLLETASVRTLDDQALLADPGLRAGDPALSSVVGLNDPDAYAAARARPAPEVTVECFGVHARSGDTAAGPRTVRAATLGAAAGAVGLEVDRHLLAAVNGDTVVRDVQVPLVHGDVLTFLSADAGG